MVGVRYITPAYDPSGYGTAGRNYIVALHKAGVQVTLLPVSFDKEHPDLGDTGVLLKKLEHKKEFDINIIHLTPEHYELNRFLSDKLNIGYFVWETNKLPTPWPGYIDHIDTVFTACQWNKEVILNDRPDKDVYIIPHGIDLAHYKHSSKLEVEHLPEDQFIFYSISQWTARKNFRDLLIAYWTEFTGHDDVTLLIKTYGSDFSDQENMRIRNEILMLKSQIKLPHYPRVIGLWGCFSDKQIVELHNLGDVFILLSHAEGFGLPYLEAMAAGNPCIATGYGGVLDFINDENGWLVEARERPVYGMPWIRWYEGTQCWGDPDIMHARACMREAYENRDMVKGKGKKARKTAERYSWEEVGKLYKNILEKLV